MGRHRKHSDNELNKVALDLINKGDMEGAKRVVSSTSLDNQKAIRNRILKGKRT